MALHFSVIFLAIYLLSQMRTSDAFRWEDCGKGNDALQFKSFSLSPQPVRYPGTVRLGWSAQVKRSLRGMQVQSQYYKKDGHWVKIPCPEIYHCDVDVCKALGKETSCAFNTGLFVRPEHEYVHSSSIPSGDYYGELHFFSSGQHVGCVRVYYEVIGA
ncbi:ganglioside GM2 activator-like [Pristis pectinata]|uniref:ganglioside GM2 activator-like n=1 Tax=Pristis pectinata TaxID=685728 RepID=UPI00223D5F19|nr:ganglioside GM2 activator-like [Pristis pectinata]